MDKTFFIVNLRYTPGNWQHMESFAGCLEQAGIPFRFLMSSGYRWMNRNFNYPADYTAYSNDIKSILQDVSSLLLGRWLGIVQIWKKYPPSGLLLVSWHPLNFFLVRVFKALYPGAQVISWIHEPYKEDKRVYGTKAVFIFLIELFQDLSLRVTDVAVMHSRRGLRLFNIRYPWFKGKTYVIPLQYRDGGPSLSTHRPYVSFLGRADQAKGIELFFELVSEAGRYKPDWKYQIVTSSNIRPYLQKLPADVRTQLHVVNRTQLSDEEILAGATNSLAVAAFYKETMQSGIIPIAFMKGAPVIGTDIEGITEWVRDRETGVIISRHSSVEEIKEAITYIHEHFEEMSAACRASYLKTFDDRLWSKQYAWLLDFLRGGQGTSSQSASGPNNKESQLGFRH
jgi:glycosyltransferase involved in cell wall biosynthesis